MPLELCLGLRVTLDLWLAQAGLYELELWAVSIGYPYFFASLLLAVGNRFVMEASGQVLPRKRDAAGPVGPDIYRFAATKLEREVLQ